MVKIQLRRGTASAWTTANPTLSAGEPGYETDTGKLKLGDGTTAWTSVAYIGAGTGDVVGPGSAVDNAVCRYDTTTGKLIQSSGDTIADDGTFTARSGVTGSNGSITLRTGANPAIEIRGDVTNGYYPGLEFYWAGGGKTASITGYGGLFIAPEPGFTVSICSYYVNSKCILYKSAYVGVHSVPLVSVAAYQGIDTLKIWQDGAIDQHGTAAQVSKGLRPPVATSATATGSGSSLSPATYYYKITTHNFKNESIGSNEVSATVTTDENITVAWTVPDNEGVDHYRVYRSTTAGSYPSSSLVSQAPAHVPYYLGSFVDTGYAATSGTPPTSKTHVSSTVRAWDGQTGDLKNYCDHLGNVLTRIKAGGEIAAPGIAYRSGSADPTTSDISDGHGTWWRNTTAGEVRYWVNVGATMYKSAALT